MGKKKMESHSAITTATVNTLKLQGKKIGRY